MNPIRVCPSCRVPVEDVQVAGRTRKYKGEVFEIPADMPIRTCSKCKAEWMTTAEVQRLQTFLEARA